MEFRIADTFTDSLAKLNGEEQKAVKTTAFDLQMNPAHPGLQFHKLDKAKDHNFWSVRVSSNLRLIVHKTGTSLLLCYVGHHDEAYEWAERRKLETHPKTGAAQLVEIRERVQEITIPKYVEPQQGPNRLCLQICPTANYLPMVCLLSGYPMCAKQTTKLFWTLPITFRKRQRRRYSTLRQEPLPKLHGQPWHRWRLWQERMRS
jgi:mRNA-degrading endonuclease RelE of RelBE toxin-antitoxin system